jgi:hypothetical protein
MVRNVSESTIFMVSLDGICFWSRSYRKPQDFNETSIGDSFTNISADPLEKSPS